MNKSQARQVGNMTRRILEAVREAEEAMAGQPAPYPALHGRILNAFARVRFDVDRIQDATDDIENGVEGPGDGPW